MLSLDFFHYSNTIQLVWDFVDQLFTHSTISKMLKPYDMILQNVYFCFTRSQSVVLDGEESDSVPVTSGGPSGLCAGAPILFLIHINDLPD